MTEIDIKDINQITEIIKRKYNYDFSDYALSSFKRRIQRVMDLQKLKSPESIIQKLETSKSYFDDFLSEITVNVTEMFRDPTFWIALRDEILIPFFKNNNKISIWHAGCSSGEEVYSMAILLNNLNKLKDAKIHASDIDEKILTIAKNKNYTDKNMEVNASNYKEVYPKDDLFKFFNKKEHAFILNQDLSQNIVFKKQNIVSEKSINKFDLILCRNVLIYFNQKLQNHVLVNLTDSLLKGGHLCIGSKESLIWCESINRYKEINRNEKIFKKTRE